MDPQALYVQVFGSAKHDLLIVDPYMDEKVLTEFGALVEKVLYEHLKKKGYLKA
jgi:hypothetical protein